MKNGDSGCDTKKMPHGNGGAMMKGGKMSFGQRMAAYRAKKGKKNGGKD